MLSAIGSPMPNQPGMRESGIDTNTATNSPITIPSVTDMSLEVGTSSARSASLCTTRLETKGVAMNPTMKIRKPSSNA